MTDRLGELPKPDPEARDRSRDELLEQIVAERADLLERLADS
jgi:hypothetical protein